MSFACLIYILEGICTVCQLAVFTIENFESNVRTKMNRYTAVLGCSSCSVNWIVSSCDVDVRQTPLLSRIDTSKWVQLNILACKDTKSAHSWIT